MRERPGRLVDGSLGLAALAYLALAVAWTAPASLSPAQSVPDLGDPLHLAWVMAWDAHQVVRDPVGLFDSNSFHPHARSLTFADHLLPEALLVAPVFWLTGNAVLASNLAVLAALVLCALSLDLLVREIAGSRAAGFLAGLAYAFQSFSLHERLRVHVLSVEWWPLALLFLLRFVRSGRRRDAAWLAAALTLQGLSGSYYLAYTALLLPLWLPVAYLACGRRPGGRELAFLAAALAVGALVMAPVLWPYAVQFRQLGLEKSWTGGADALAYLEPARGNVVWGWLDFPGDEPELPHFVGLAALALAAAGTARVLAGRLERPARALGLLGLVTAAVGFALSLGPVVQVGGHRLGTGPYEWLYRLVPLSRGMASPERAGVLVILGVALLAGLGAAGLLAPWGPWPRRLAVAALAVWLPLEHWSPPRDAAFVPTGGALPSVYRWLASDGPTPVVELPLHPDRSRRLWAAYLYFSTYHWRPIPIGRTSFYPPGHDLLAWSLREFPDDVSLTLLARLGIHTVVVHPMMWTADERRNRLAALDVNTRLALVRRFDDVVPARYAALGLGEERVYRLADGPPPSSPCTPADEIGRNGWTFDSTGINQPARVADGDRRRAWFTARPQRPGDRLDVGLPRPERLAAVVLEAAYPYEEFARNLVLLLRDRDGRLQRTAWADGPEERWSDLDELVHRPTAARLVLRFPAQEATGVRLMVGFREEDPAWPRWSVPELRLYRECR